MEKLVGIILTTLLLGNFTHAEQKRLIAVAPSKTAVVFPDTTEGQIAIQTGAGQYEVLSYMEADGHAFAMSCETDMKRPCKAQDLKAYFTKSQKELSEKCNQTHGESRIARRHGVRKITSVCYFKEDKSFVEFN